MTPRILLVNPPIHDFSAYDFWLKPYGLLRVAGYLRQRADMRLFDHLDRFHPALPEEERPESDSWGRGKFYAEVIPRPAAFAEIPRRYRRFGIPGRCFQDFLAREGPLWHNKTAYPMVALGESEVNRLKSLARELNQRVANPPPHTMARA